MVSRLSATVGVHFQDRRVDYLMYSILALGCWDQVLHGKLAVVVPPEHTAATHGEIRCSYRRKFKLKDKGFYAIARGCAEEELGCHSVVASQLGMKPDFKCGC